ncbi:MAG: alpha/beta fold hydrolase, partial [Actinomycetota bacterium]
AELDALVGSVARVIREHWSSADAGPSGRPVPLPVVVGRDRWSVVALLAAMRAGVAHVPIAADLPPAALAQLLDRLGRPSVVLGPPGLHLPVPAGVTLVPAALEVDDPIGPQPVEPDAVAVVLFTSGSTGRPKGVVFSWRNLGALAAQADFRVAAAEHRGLTAPLHWAGGYSVTVRIGNGRSVSLQPPGPPDPVALLEWLDREQVDLVSVPPSFAAQLVGRWPAGRRLERVRRLNASGEHLLWEHVPGLRALIAPDAVIEGVYGSTEGGSIAVCRMVIGPDHEVESGRIPLGEWELPRRGRLEPVADAGGDLAEIVVAGGVAHGYWDDPELEATQFGRDPDGTRVLRTGDLARIDDRGRLTLAGRVDELVKVRGIRVEPAEVERGFERIAGIRQSVVLAHATDRGTRLVAHLVLDPGASCTPASVRHTLAERLPPHLVPSPLVVHDDLPRLPNGKIDRQTLRSGPVEPWRTATPRPPRDALEADVLVVCAEVLELDDVGLDDDLWELGLDSLRAVELAGGVSELGWGPFDPSLPLRHVSAAGIAEALREGAAGDDPYRPSEVVCLTDGSPTGPAPVVAFPGAGGTATTFVWLARALGPDHAFSVVEAHGLHTPGRPDRTIAAAADRAADLVVTAHPTGPLVLVGHSAGGAVAYETAGRLVGRGRTVRVVLLDVCLTARPHGAGPDAPVLPDPPAGGTAPTGTRARRRLRRLPRRIFDEARLRWRTLRPGPPSRDLVRFRAFGRIGERALREFRPGPPTFPTRLLHVDDRARADWTAFVPELDCRVVPGLHLTMLRPPHVDVVAEQVRALSHRD